MAPSLPAPPRGKRDIGCVFGVNPRDDRRKIPLAAAARCYHDIMWTVSTVVVMAIVGWIAASGPAAVLIGRYLRWRAAVESHAERRAPSTRAATPAVMIEGSERLTV